MNQNKELEEQFLSVNLRDKIIHYHQGIPSPALSSYQKFLQKKNTTKKRKKKICKKVKLPTLTRKKKSDLQTYLNDTTMNDFDYSNADVDRTQTTTQEAESTHKHKVNMSYDQIIDFIHTPEPGPFLNSSYLNKLQGSWELHINKSFNSRRSSVLTNEMNIPSQQQLEINYQEERNKSRQNIDVQKFQLQKYSHYFQPRYQWNDTEKQYMNDEQIETSRREKEKQSSQELRKKLKLQKLYSQKPFKLQNRREKSQTILLENLRKIIDATQFTSEQKQKFSSVMPLISYFDQKQEILLRQLIFKNFPEIQQIVFTLMEKCQEVNEIQFFTKLSYYLGGLSLDFEQTHQAIFFFHQCMILSEVTQNYKMKCKVLQALSDCARRLQLYDQSLQLIKKALMYSWKGHFFHEEIHCFDLMGLTYFYMGDLQKALYFHTKWVLAEHEPEHGYFRDTSKAFVAFYERYLGYFTKEFTKMLMVQLSLPILNLFDPIEIINEDGVKQTTYNRCDHYKMIRYNNCDGIAILSSILNGIEFLQFSIDYYQKQKKLRKDSSEKLKRIQVRVPLPKRIREIQLKYQSEQKDMMPRDQFENPLLKPDLNKLLSYRLKKIFSLHEINDRIAKNIGVSRQPFQKQEQIYVRHINEKFQKPEQHEMFYKRHEQFFTKLINNLLKEKLM